MVQCTRARTATACAACIQEHRTVPYNTVHTSIKLAIHFRVLSGVKLLGGNLHICLYVCIYTHMQRGAAQRILFNDIKNHTHACSMHIRFSYRIMMKMRQWQSIVMYVMGGRYVCGMIVV